MNLYFKISKLKFYVILILILLIPVSKKYRLLIFGTWTEGIAVGYGENEVRSTAPVRFDHTLFRFETEKGSFEIQGPESIIYNLGDKTRVIYAKKNPGHCMIFSFASLYSAPNAVIPGVLLLLWIAFYTSFSVAEKKTKVYLRHSS
jgi:hypothetical protein